jgi:hypothetical protein
MCISGENSSFRYSITLRLPSEHGGRVMVDFPLLYHKEFPMQLADYFDLVVTVEQGGEAWHYTLLCGDGSKATMQLPHCPSTPLALFLLTLPTLGKTRAEVIGWRVCVRQAGHKATFVVTSDLLP